MKHFRKRSQEHIRLLMAMIIMFTLLTSLTIRVGAEPWNLTNATAYNSTAPGINPLSESSTTTGGGKTSVDLTIITQSLSWQAYYGDVFQKIELTDGINQFYDWTNANPEGEIYATTSSYIDWSQIKCADYDTVINEQQSMTGSDTDRVNNTFDSANVQSFSVGAIPFSSGACSYATYTIDSSGSKGTFEEVLLESQNNLIYTSIVSTGGFSFTGQSADFQMLVAEDGTDQIETEYYFYVELE